jgi:hypothetical protein
MDFVAHSYSTLPYARMVADQNGSRARRGADDRSAAAELGQISNPLLHILIIRQYDNGYFALDGGVSKR